MGRHSRIGTYFLIGIVACALASFSTVDPSKSDWGFFGHKRINRLAVFTLPEAMLPLFKEEIEFVTEHAVDPDKRRYATRHEAVRHYIDIDQWGSYPFDDLPRTFPEAIMKYAEILVVNPQLDTFRASWQTSEDSTYLNSNSDRWHDWTFVRYRDLFFDQVMPNYYEGPVFSISPLPSWLSSKKIEHVFIIDRFSEHGILPYNLISYHHKLTRAFESADYNRALRLATEMGHYIGDAHVPLHTTTNYNGQLTDQIGIHAFWESRIPELFADDHYDYFVGRAQLIDDIPTFYWDMVLSSHLLVDSVLQIEKRLSQTFPADQQYCYEDRNFINISQPCPAYALAFSEAMNGMVEERFRASIHAIGSAWYTAWHHAGRPDLSATESAKVVPAADTIPVKPDAAPLGRPHAG